MATTTKPNKKSVHGRRVPHDIKELAVKYFLTQDRNYVHVAKHFNCSPRSVKRWVEKLGEHVKRKFNIAAING